jgi:hypothetical protein
MSSSLEASVRIGDAVLGVDREVRRGQLSTLADSVVAVI